MGVVVAAGTSLRASVRRFLMRAVTGSAIGMALGFVRAEIAPTLAHSNRLCPYQSGHAVTSVLPAFLGIGVATTTSRPRFLSRDMAAFANQLGVWPVLPGRDYRLRRIGRWRQGMFRCKLRCHIRGTLVDQIRFAEVRAQKLAAAGAIVVVGMTFDAAKKIPPGVAGTIAAHVTVAEYAEIAWTAESAGVGVLGTMLAMAVVTVTGER